MFSFLSFKFQLPKMFWIFFSYDSETFHGTLEHLRDDHIFVWINKNIPFNIQSKESAAYQVSQPVNQQTFPPATCQHPLCTLCVQETVLVTPNGIFLMTSSTCCLLLLSAFQHCTSLTLRLTFAPNITFLLCSSPRTL